MEKEKKCVTEKHSWPFQRGMIITFKALLLMFPYLQDKYEVEFIITSRCNHDSLENLFSRLRQIGGSNEYPSPVDALNRIRLLMLGKQAEFAIPNTPVKCRSIIEETQDMPPLNQLEPTSISKEEEFEHHNSEDCISL
ncbi:unnamed protein product [Lepeophtheirus salmonis]|uniref:(salmon louse) hypothetical protein n=1 Tax=Lepeophtheirus salmonis TaxID=72036 RepID=A0A7R8CTS5_LEPSM|nr:unnamed protein product [Lepeophtheirus salmonis]CAF2876256.1 unnamed protein product [Lepeophtheirus salmonis]